MQPNGTISTIKRFFSVFKDSLIVAAWKTLWKQFILFSLKDYEKEDKPLRIVGGEN